MRNLPSLHARQDRLTAWLNNKDHGRCNKTAASKGQKANCCTSKSYQCRSVVSSFFPLVYQHYHKQCCHNKLNTCSIKMYHIPQKSHPEERIYKGKSFTLHHKAIGHAQKQKSHAYGKRIRKRCPQCLFFIINNSSYYLYFTVSCHASPWIAVTILLYWASTSANFSWLPGRISLPLSNSVSSSLGL